MEDLLSSQPVTLKEVGRIQLFRNMIGENTFSRKEYMRHFKDISSATASRDLRETTDNQILTRIGEGRTTVYRF